MAEEDTLFPRSPLEKLLALKDFLGKERGHRLHLLIRAQEDENADGGKIRYWKSKIHEIDDRQRDVDSLIEWHDCESSATGGKA